MFEDDAGAELIDAMSAAARAESAAIAARLRVIGQLDARREAELAETIFWTTDPFEAVAAEVSAALNISRGRAGTQIRRARALRDRLPQVAALFAAGLIDYRMVIEIIHRTETVAESVCLQVDALLARHAGKWMRLSEKKLRDRIDQWVAKVDPHGERVPPIVDDGRHVTVEPAGTPGMAYIEANVRATDAAAFSQELDALAATVCHNDPRTHEQRRADAVGPLSRREAQLACQCGSPDCPAKQRRAAADAAVVHVFANQSTVDGDSDDPGYLPGYGIVPAESVRDVAATAKRKPVTVPAPDAEPEPGYRPSVALREFIGCRDVTCRWPGCDAPVQRCDVDHTVPYPNGPTHASNTKLYCRAHHLVKTFAMGWSDRQMPDGTIEFSAPTGHIYRTQPHGAALFPLLGQPTGDLVIPEPEEQNPYRDVMMPKRRKTREQDRQERIKAERRFRAELNNDLEVERQYQYWLAEHYGPPPPF